MNKSIAILLMIMAVFIVDTFVKDGGDLDRIARASGARNASMNEPAGQEASTSENMVAVSRTPASADGHANGHSAGPWDFDKESEAVAPPARPAPMAGRALPEEATGPTVVTYAPRRGRSTEVGALSSKQLKVEI